MFEPAPTVESPKTLIVYQRDSSKLDEQALEEITLLANSAGCEVIGSITAYKASPDKATYVGSGKIQEIADFVKENGVELVIFNHTITPVQERNAERQIHCRVLDRTGLILDIFAQRARTHEGKLQVELAQLQHLSTRLVRGWTHLERQKGGIGLRGPGETQLETDRRLIRHRIKHLHQRLQKVSSQRELRRKSRKKVPIPTVSLVGYTNAGKSSLFNALTQSSVYVEDQLFATLDTTMRRLELEEYGPVILSDTVGFIQNLPHTLVTAFHSTLEEVTNAQLLLHVVDSAASDREQKIADVNDVLHEIAADDIEVITVYNKIDIYDGEPKHLRNADGENERVWVSAASGKGIDLLVKAIAERLSRNHHWLKLTLSASAGKLRAALYRRNVVHSESVQNDGSQELLVRLSEADYGWLQQQSESFTVETVKPANVA